jgi:hypothetical protein
MSDSVRGSTPTQYRIIVNRRRRVWHGPAG